MSPSPVRRILSVVTRRFIVAFVVGGSVLAAVVGCHRAPPTERASDSAPIAVSNASTNLLLTWIDDRGEFHVESSPSAVPEEGRATVRVVDPSRDVAADGTVTVADLRAPNADGTYPVRTVPRDEFEAAAVERRKQHGEVLVPKAAASASLGEAASASMPTVIVYGASWCGACHDAQAYLKKRGIPFVEKDIEADPNAAREMQTKLASVRKPGGSIPVIDVGGHILVGFDPKSIDRALAGS